MPQRSGDLVSAVSPHVYRWRRSNRTASLGAGGCLGRGRVSGRTMPRGYGSYVPSASCCSREFGEAKRADDIAHRGGDAGRSPIGATAARTPRTRSPSHRFRPRRRDSRGTSSAVHPPRQARRCAPASRFVGRGRRLPPRRRSWSPADPTPGFPRYVAHLGAPHPVVVGGGTIRCSHSPTKSAVDS